MSSSDIQNLAELEIVDEKLYQEDLRSGEDFTPTAYGLLDPKLGVSSKNDTCRTCNEKYIDCPGHFGYIKLELPVFHIGFFKHTLQVLQCICKNCSEVLLTEPSKKKYLALKEKITDPMQRDKIRREMIDECKGNKICFHCDAYNGLIKKEPKIACKIF